MKVAREQKYIYEGYDHEIGYHKLRLRNCDDFECVRECKFVSLDGKSVAFCHRDGTVDLTFATMRAINK